MVSARSKGGPAGATFVSGDASTPEGVKAIATGTLEALGGLDILINNAGGGSPHPKGIASITDDDWKSAFDLNLFAAVRLTNALLPALRESNAGNIVNLSSTAATMPFPAFADYCAAKAALDIYSRALALELGPNDIRVNVVSPGPITTPGGTETRKAFSDTTGAPPDAFMDYVPLRRFGEVEDVAEVIALLTSDRGKWLTGTNIRVDGGMTAR